jgi:hypothetical protein
VYLKGKDTARDASAERAPGAVANRCEAPAQETTEYVAQETKNKPRA